MAVVVLAPVILALVAIAAVALAVVKFHQDRGHRREQAAQGGEAHRCVVPEGHSHVVMIGRGRGTVPSDREQIRSLISGINRTSLEAEPRTGPVEVRFVDEVPDPQVPQDPHVVNPGSPQNPGSADPGLPSRTIPAPDRDDPEAQA